MTGLLLLHGFLTGPDDWDLFLPTLATLYDEVVVFTQPGHARAGEKTDFSAFSEKSAYDALDDVMRSMQSKFDSVDVVGHSLGGAMALYASANYDVRHLVLLAPALRCKRSGMLSRHNGAVKRLRHAIERATEPSLKSALISHVNNVRATYDASLDLFFGRLLPNWTVRNFSTLGKIMARGESCLPKITKPFTLMWGDLDELVNPTSYDLICKGVKSTEYVTVEYQTLAHAMMYLGDITALLRDVKCALLGGDLTSLPTGKAELRKVTHVTRENGQIITTCHSDGIRLGERTTHIIQNLHTCEQI